MKNQMFYTKTNWNIKQLQMYYIIYRCLYDKKVKERILSSA